jgi:GNAT superfamily N-acetyltransferase
MTSVIAGLSAIEASRRLAADGPHHLPEPTAALGRRASYEVLNADRAKMAILVDDAWQGDGIGSLLIEQLTAVARRDGIQELVGDVLATNVSMLRTRASLAPGIARQHSEDPGVVRIQIPTQPDERALAAVGVRDRTADGPSWHLPRWPSSVSAVLRAALGTRFSAPSSPADSRAGRTRSIHTSKRLTALRVIHQLVRFLSRSIWRSSRCRPRALRRSSRSAGLLTWARPWCSARGSPRPRHPVRRRNHGFWPRRAGTTSGWWVRIALG